MVQAVMRNPLLEKPAVTFASTTFFKIGGQQRRKYSKSPPGAVQGVSYFYRILLLISLFFDNEPTNLPEVFNDF